jgi:hypothetical protein
MKRLLKTTAACAALLVAALAAPSLARANPIPLTITCPGPIVVEADQFQAAFVTPGIATATGDGVTIASPPAGLYPLGTTTVTYTATDSSGASASCVAMITVRDTLPPSITCPTPITAEADQSGGAVVSPGGASAADIGGSVTISGPGAGFYPLGTTTVTYVATDQSGNTSTCTSSITVVDTTPPTITCPPPIVVEADRFQAAFVTPGGASASDVAGSVTISGPPAGVYPLGTTLVIYTAVDESANRSSCSTSITVQDTTPPSITCPANIEVTAGAGGTAVVTYAVTASDIGGAVAITGNPASGSTFAIGTTTVTAVATDEVGNSASCSFTVTVKQGLPTSAAQCKNGGWQGFGIFKNQGDCVSFVATRGRNAPG